MAEVLSQTEIDALLSAVSTGTVEGGAAPAAPAAAGSAEAGAQPRTDWIAYDLTSQEKIVRSRLVALQGIHERFARLFRIRLTNELKKSVTVNTTSIDFLKFGDYLSNILLPTSLNVIAMSELRGYMLYVVSSKLVYALVDAYYGGNERPYSKIGGREEFTKIESNMIGQIAQFAVKDLEDAWSLNFPMKLEYIRSENNPHFVGCIHTSELVAVVTFEVEFENLSGPCVLIIQLRALDPIQEFLGFNITGEFSADKEAWRQHWLKEILTTELLTQVELGHATRTLRQIEGLKVGDVIGLHQDSVEPLTVYVQGLPKLHGMMGTFRGNSAVRLSHDLETQMPENEEKGADDGTPKAANGDE